MSDVTENPSPNLDLEDLQQRAVEIHFVGGEDLPILFASNIFIRTETLDFLVSFAQAHGPWDLNPDIRRIIRDGIDAKVVASLAIPADKWKDMIETAVANYDQWAKRSDGRMLELDGYQRVPVDNTRPEPSRAQ